MIDYANELIKEIQDNHPTNSTEITFNGLPIKRVKYVGVGLEIECDDLEYVEKWEYDNLQEEFDSLNEDYEILQGDYDALEETTNKYEKCLREIQDKIEKKGQWDTFTDEIVEMIEGVLE